ncbi:hypothetical protein [Paraburkholderia adhaesiva]|uniref:hypothetical protein n=1 Tax=Paraburkholderia adhaesiva TaxID=2883244 RepID=UPI001F1D22B2|nr:hypothetical protein [Paraburkholderia adhaesiva]
MDDLTLDELEEFEVLSLLTYMQGGKLITTHIDTLTELCARHAVLDVLFPLVLKDAERFAFVIMRIAVMRAQLQTKGIR